MRCLYLLYIQWVEWIAHYNKCYSNQADFKWTFLNMTIQLHRSFGNENIECEALHYFTLSRPDLNRLFIMWKKAHCTTHN